MPSTHIFSRANTNENSLSQTHSTHYHCRSHTYFLCVIGTDSVCYGFVSEGFRLCLCGKICGCVGTSELPINFELERSLLEKRLHGGLFWKRALLEVSFAKVSYLGVSFGKNKTYFVGSFGQRVLSRSKPYSLNPKLLNPQPQARWRERSWSRRRSSSKMCCFVYALYMCVYMYMYMYMYTYMYIYIYMYVYVHMYVHIYMHMYKHTYIHIWVLLYIRTQIYIYICIYVYMYIYIHISKRHTTDDTTLSRFEKNACI